MKNQKLLLLSDLLMFLVSGLFVMKKAIKMPSGKKVVDLRLEKKPFSLQKTTIVLLFFMKKINVNKIFKNR